MARVLVTGMSGTGKSAVLRELATRGHGTVDTDSDEWCEWITDASGEPDWIWREDAIRRLLETHAEGHLFVAGCKTNQGRFYASFDRIVLLTAPTGVLLARIDARTDNPYGKSATERSQLLTHIETVLPLLRSSATDVMDTTETIESVADRLELVADGMARHRTAQ